MTMWGRTAVLAAAAGLAMVAGCSQAVQDFGDQMVDQTAPDFTLETLDGNKVSLKEFKGRHVILYFYPKDNTSG